MGIRLQSIKRILKLIQKCRHASRGIFGKKQSVFLPVAIVMLNGITVNIRPVREVVKSQNELLPETDHRRLVVGLWIMQLDTSNILRRNEHTEKQ